MKNSIKFIFTIAITLLFTSNLASQNCIVSNTDTPSGTMGRKTNKALFIGQSFTACKNGKLTAVLFRIGGGNQVADVELRVFEMKKIAKKPIFTQKITLPKPLVPIKNFKDTTIKLKEGGLQLEDGKVYTIGLFKAKSNQKKLLRFKSDNKNNYKEGSLVSNFKIPGGKKQNKNVDMLFQITIE